MPESLQQKVDRMTAGMEVTVTFNGTRPGTVTGPVTSEGGVLFVVGRPVRFNDGRVNPFITAIDMPDPACPFEMGARVLADGDKRPWTVTGWAFIVGYGAWMVRLEDDAGIRGRSGPGDLTLVPPVPAEPDCPAILVTWTSSYLPPRLCERQGDRFGQLLLSEWLTRPDVATVQALRPAEYLRGGQ